MVYGTYRYRVRYGSDEQTGVSERVFVKRDESEAEREGRHLPNFRIGVGLQQPDKLRHAIGQTDSANRQRRSAANARLAIAQQPE